MRDYDMQNMTDIQNMSNEMNDKNMTDKTRSAYDEEMQILSRQLEEEIIDENEYMKFGSKLKYEYEYRNITSTVKGLYNIKDVIKMIQIIL